MLYLVTESSENLEKILRISLEAIRLGVEFLQIRNKVISKNDFIELSKEIIQRKRDTKIIINDYVELANQLNADGVHIGQQDMDPISARKLLGNKILGLSVENIEQTKKANNYNLSYVAVSPVFATTSKHDTAKPCGLEQLAKIKQISRHKVFAIGGINENNAKNVIKAGADGICLVSEIYSSPFPSQKIVNLQKIINSNI